VSTPEPQITYFICPPTCDAGGRPEDGDHIFDTTIVFFACADCGQQWAKPLGYRPDHSESSCRTYAIRESGWSETCSRCGLSHMDWTLMRPVPPCDHTLVRNRRVPEIVSCSKCCEGTAYLFGHPGSDDAVKLGCRCPIIDNCHGLGRPAPSEFDSGRRIWMTSRACRLHTPADELELETETTE
jgi:hypothetical protein